MSDILVENSIQIEVNGKDTSPLYKFLKSEKGGLFVNAIKWNFTKFLVNKEGKVVERYAPTTSPLAIEVGNSARTKMNVNYLRFTKAT